jgi:hypothetical protein
MRVTVTRISQSAGNQSNNNMGTSETTRNEGISEIKPSCINPNINSKPLKKTTKRVSIHVKKHVKPKTDAE